MKNITIIDIINNKEGLYEGNLQHYYYPVMNGSHKTNTYHNVRHNLHVMWEIYDAIKFHTIEPRTARSLLIAGMMHDYRHTGDGTISDSINIRRAKDGLHRLLEKKDSVHKQTIFHYIDATEVMSNGKPFRVPTNLGESIIMDADMGESLSNTWQQDILYGLAKEKGYTWQQMLKMQIPFLKSLSFYTSWANQKFELILSERIIEVIAMEKILIKK